MFTAPHTEPDFIRDIGKEIVANGNLQSAVAQAALFDPIEDAASFGRWWFDSATSQIVLSTVAAGFLDMNVGLQDSHELCSRKNCIRFARCACFGTSLHRNSAEARERLHHYRDKC